MLVLWWQGVLKKGEPWPTELLKARLRETFLARLLPTTVLTRGVVPLTAPTEKCPAAVCDTSSHPD